MRIFRTFVACSESSQSCRGQDTLAAKFTEKRKCTGSKLTPCTWIFVSEKFMKEDLLDRPISVNLA